MEIISYSGGENYTFVNENGESINAVSTPVERITDTERPGPESCNLSEYHVLKSRLHFDTLNFAIGIEISSLYGTQIQLLDLKYGEYAFKRFYLDRDNGEFLSIEEYLTNISILGFVFENVLVFRDYENNSEFHRIIFSPQNGIEFIEYDNGSYLMYAE
jgi:hypothetical protein